MNPQAKHDKASDTARVAIVTGGSMGIGASVVELLVSRGNYVVIGDISDREGIELCANLNQPEEFARFVHCDVSVSADCERLIQQTMDQFGRIDWLVNNAGISPAVSTTETSEELWDRVMRVNLKSAWLCSKYAIPHLAKQPGAAIVNVASDAGLVGFPNLAAYCASKGGMIQFTKACALDCTTLGIRVNAVAPGHTRTPMGTRFIDQQEDPEAFIIEHVNKSHPIGRMAEAQEVADAICYLLSSAASYITGTVLSVDGGYVAR